MTQKFKNTFAPNSLNKEFTLDDVRACMKYGVITVDMLPAEIIQTLKNTK